MRPSAVYRVLLQLQRVISLRRTTQVPRRVEVWKFDIQLRCVLAHRAPAYGAQHGCEGRMCRHRSLYCQFQNALASELAFFLFYSGLQIFLASPQFAFQSSVKAIAAAAGRRRRSFSLIFLGGSPPILDKDNRRIPKTEGRRASRGIDERI